MTIGIPLKYWGGGVWNQIKDKFILSAGDTYAKGSTGGEAAHTLSEDEMPTHTHTRGTMNITGTIGYFRGDASAYFTSSGAFSTSSVSKGSYTGNTQTTGIEATFNAADTWTGSTSSTGSSQAHNNMPPYVAYNCWVRVE